MLYYYFKAIKQVHFLWSSLVLVNHPGLAVSHIPTFLLHSAFSIIAAVASEYCEPCPTNGVCYDGKLKCGHGYRKQGKLCVEDGDINKAAKKLVRDICNLHYFLFLYIEL